MSVELIVPEVGESITEVEIGRWLKKEGEPVRKDDPLVEIETDKVTLELPAPADGQITKITKKQGEPATVGDPIATFTPGTPDPESPAPETPDPGTLKTEDTPPQASPAPIMPAAQRLLDQHKLNPKKIEATGPGGRLLKEDVQRVVDQPSEAAAPEPKPAPKPSTPSADTTREEIVPMTPLRRTIAKTLVEVQQTAALLTTFNEVDMSAVMNLRKQYKEAFLKKYNVKLGFMSFFTKAVIDALKQYPSVNAEVRGTDVIYKNHYDIGIAVGTGKGLVVPVLRDADRMSFSGVELAINGFVEKIKTNKITLEDLTGGTFTITNGGVFGSMLSTPIVNAPQSAILGMHAIIDRPVAIEGEVKIRPMMYLALTYDHRLVDGREAVSFLVRIKETIESPSRMLMEV